MHEKKTHKDFFCESLMLVIIYKHLTTTPYSKSTNAFFQCKLDTWNFSSLIMNMNRKWTRQQWKKQGTAEKSRKLPIHKNIVRQKQMKKKPKKNTTYIILKF